MNSGTGTGRFSNGQVLNRATGYGRWSDTYRCRMLVCVWSEEINHRSFVLKRVWHPRRTQSSLRGGELSGPVSRATRAAPDA